MCPVAVAPEDPQSYYSRRRAAHRRARRVPAQPVRQPGQPAGPREDDRARAVGADRRADHPLRRRRRHVRHRSPAPPATSRRRTPTIRIVAADPEGSVFSGGSGRPYLVEGVGEDFFPAAWEPDLYDEVIADQRRGELPHRPPGVARSRASSSAAPAGWPSPRRSRSPSGPDPTTSSSCSTPTPAAATCRACSTTSGWPTSGSSASASECVGAVLDTRGGIAELLYVNPDQTVRAGDRADARQRRQPAAGVQEHAAVRRRRGVRRRSTSSS